MLRSGMTKIACSVSDKQQRRGWETSSHRKMGSEVGNVTPGSGQPTSTDSDGEHKLPDAEATVKVGTGTGGDSRRYRHRTSSDRFENVTDNEREDNADDGGVDGTRLSALLSDDCMAKTKSGEGPSSRLLLALRPSLLKAYSVWSRSVCGRRTKVLPQDRGPASQV